MPVLALLAVGWSPSLVVAAALAYGVALTIFEALYMTELQKEIPHDKLSRVMSYELLASFAFIPIGAPLVGALATSIGVSEMIWLGAAVVLAASVAPLTVGAIRRSRRVVDVSDVSRRLPRALQGRGDDAAVAAAGVGAAAAPCRRASARAG